MEYLAHPNSDIIEYPNLTPLPFGHSAKYHGVACDGSLLFHEDAHDLGLLRLTSPFLGKTRLLPSLLDVSVSYEAIELDAELARPGQWSDGDMMAVQKMVLLPNGVIAALLGRDRFSKLALCSLEISFSWVMSAYDGWRKYEDMALCGGRLYAVMSTEDLIAFDIHESTIGGPVVSRIDLVIMGGYATRHYAADVPMAQYLVVFVSSRTGEDGMMFMVRQPLEIGEGEQPRIAVFRADMCRRCSGWR